VQLELVVFFIDKFVEVELSFLSESRVH